MAALQNRRVRLLASLYATYGEPATWTPAGGGAAVPLTLRRRGEEVAVGFGSSEAILNKEVFRIRKAELATPGEGDLVTVLDPDTGDPVAAFRIVGEPRLVKAGLEWVCEPGQALTL